MPASSETGSQPGSKPSLSRKLKIRVFRARCSQNDCQLKQRLSTGFKGMHSEQVWSLHHDQTNYNYQLITETENTQTATIFEAVF